MVMLSHSVPVYTHSAIKYSQLPFYDERLMFLTSCHVTSISLNNGDSAYFMLCPTYLIHPEPQLSDMFISLVVISIIYIGLKFELLSIIRSHVVTVIRFCNIVGLF